ncbi:BCCT family transporter [Otariodibacter sp.]|uniref:BCCT family transporter n=1 Tax=Otariodibacter sp. TaxID=3030919 RepID=UPI002618048D|nr:BCCT family transporter [Otariodibacter sp.]
MFPFKFNSTFNKKVVFSSLILCSIIIGFVIFKPEWSLSHLYSIKRIIFKEFSWFYILTSAFFIFFLGFLSLSRYGDIKLGMDEEEPEFSQGAWFSLLFTAGMGIGIIFLGIAEPLSHVVSPLSDQYVEREALFQSIFHWSINAWAIYGVIALAIAYFGFRYKLPLSLRSCFYPILKQKIDGVLGDIIDILGLCTTLFGLVTTLAYSAIRLTNAFANYRISIQIILGGIFIVAIMLSMRKLAHGLKIISQINLTLSIVLLIFVLITGPTAYLMSAFTENIGYYLSGFINTGFRTYVYEPEKTKWFTDWTILYWAWWFSWAPSFGIFIARISRGRSIREFIFGILIVPSIFFIIWFTVFGNSAIWINDYLADGKLNELISQAGKLLFAFLDYLPFSSISYYVTVAIILLFFITTIDFGIYILNNISSRDKSIVSPNWQAIMWGGLLAGITFILFRSGGLDALHSTMLIFSLPFVFLMLGMAYSLIKGLKFDYYYYNTELNNQAWDNKEWRDQLTELLTTHDKKEMLFYLKHTVLTAMRELRQELIGIYDLDVHLETEFEHSLPKVLFTIETPNKHLFSYVLEAQLQITENTELNDEIEKTYPLQVTINEGEFSYEIQHIGKKELIVDILQQYEQHLQN